MSLFITEDTKYTELFLELDSLIINLINDKLKLCVRVLRSEYYHIFPYLLARTNIYYEYCIQQ